MYPPTQTAFILGVEMGANLKVVRTMCIPGASHLQFTNFYIYTFLFYTHFSFQFSSAQFSHSVVSNSLRPHES